MANLIDITRVNSTTYLDVAGLALGLPRLPGEESPSYLTRLERAANALRNHPYQGVLNQVSLQMGLAPASMIAVTSPDPSAVMVATLNGLAIAGAGITLRSPLLIVDPDNYWSYRLLSDVAADIVQLPGFSATLLVPDGPAFQLAQQTNLLVAMNEPVTSSTMQLSHGGVVVGSEVFNQSTPNYSLSVAGQLDFVSGIPAGLLISYQYVLWPYALAGSPAVLLSLLDPGVQSAATGNHSLPVHQIQEVLQTVMQQDRSYWSR